MSTYTGQTLIIGNTPVGFNVEELNKNSLKRPQIAFGVVEGNDIRVSATISPTNTTGILAPVGSTVTITTEGDIEYFLAITTDPLKTAKIYFEFGV